ncbi:MAG TPA: metallophosphoesterase family protein [Polyangiaceae bacterium]|nr:metallophosphoesterase family protein [Polyangiaceae bacterium]
MRIALLSDLHGNEVALDAVLADVSAKGADRIVCLGDTAALGPSPRAVLARLRDLGCPCILGNHDAFMLDASLIHGYNDSNSIVRAVDWCRSELSREDLEFIAGFAPSLSIELSDRKQLLLFHGSPRSHMEDLLCTTSPEMLDDMLAGHLAAVMAGGHTHIPMLRQHRGMLLVNPGSVGMAFERYVCGKVPTLLAHAEWASVDASRGHVSVSLHRVELDRRTLRAAAGSVDHPLAAWLCAQYA